MSGRLPPSILSDTDTSMATQVAAPAAPGGPANVAKNGQEAEFERSVRHRGDQGTQDDDALQAARQALDKAKTQSLLTASEAPPWFQNMHNEVIAGQAVTREEARVMRSEINRISNQQQKTDTRMTELERQFQSLRSNPTSNASVSTTAGASLGPGGAQKLHWNRSFVELTGWTNWKGTTLQRSQSMMRDSDATQLIVNVKATLPQEISAKFDDLGTLRLNGNRIVMSSVKLKFVAGTEDSVFWEIKQILEDAFTPDAERTAPQLARAPPPRASMFVNLATAPATVKVRLEAPPWKKGHIAACGRFYGTWREMIGINPTMDIKAETGSGQGVSSIWSKPSDPSRRPVEVAVFRISTGTWTVHRDTWDGAIRHNANISCTYEDFTTALNR